MYIFDLKTGTTKETHTLHTDKILSLLWNKVLVSTGFDSKIVVWDAEKSECVQVVQLPNIPVSHMVQISENTHISCHLDGSMLVWAIGQAQKAEIFDKCPNNNQELARLEALLRL